MKRLYLAWAAIVLTTLLWATSLILAKIVYSEVTPIIFVALRYTIASPFLILLVLLSRRRSENLRNSRLFWKSILLAGFLGPFLSQVLQYIGLSMTSAGETLLLLNMSPVFAVILAAPLLKESITTDKIGGLILATLGASFIVLGGAPIDSEFGMLRIAGDLIIIVSTLLFALNGIAGKTAVGGVDSISVATFSTIFAVPFLWLSALLFEDISILFQLTPMVWLVVLWVGIVNSVIAFIFYYESMRYIEASRVQIALNLIAVWGIIMSVLILGEPTSFLQVLGGLLTIIGVIIAQKRFNERKSDSVPQNGSNIL
ncbi:MAG: DMT family transporter [Candidatus Thorarchaeota archaeon]